MKKLYSAVLAAAFAMLAFGSPAPARAELPSWLKKQNSDVDDGNEALRKGDAKGALEAYNKAARKLPDAPGVALDRGIALLKQGDYAKAREALLQATVPNASTDVRADAYQDLSLAFYREADGLASQNNHKDAQKMFREALDAAKRSLHLRPGDPNTAWNMELAARRVREEEQKQKEEEQKQKDQQKQDGDKEKQDGDQQNQDPNQQQDQNKDPKQDGDQGDDQKQDQGKQDKPDKPEPQKPEEQKGQPDKPKQPDKPDSEQKQPSEPDAQQPPEKALPPEAKQALDSLENGEENFERYRARQRASRERRAPEKDW